MTGTRPGRTAGSSPEHGRPAPTGSIPELIRQLLPGSVRDLEITSCRADATLSDLAAAIAPRVPGRSVWVDGCRVPADTKVAGAGLMNGSTVSLHPVPVPPRRRHLDGGAVRRE